MKVSFAQKATRYLTRGPLETLQVNLGNLCNQECRHCHIGASPKGDKIMGEEAIETVLAFLWNNPGLTLDITGGAPELNPGFRRLAAGARPLVPELIVRSNLTVLLEPGQEDTISFLAANKVKIIASLPCYTEENVEAQRGTGVFEKSVEVLKMLNEAGYGRSDELRLDLVYNPEGPYLPGALGALEAAYKEQLYRDHGVVFDRLITITNAPIGRFALDLKASKGADRYMQLLVDNFNEETLPRIMCRHTVSVDYRGFLCDCDFNQAMGMVLLDANGDPIHISTIRAADLDGRKIAAGAHCFCCTAGVGSSCGGALV